MTRGELPHIADDCPKRDYCLGVSDGKLPCPVSKSEIVHYKDRNPLTSPEQLCVRAMENHGSRPCSDPYKERCRNLDYHLDMAIAKAPYASIEERQSHIKSITDILAKIDQVSYRERGRQSYHIHARAVEAFLPAFRDRIAMEPISHESAITSHANLCNLLRDFDDNYLRIRPSRNDINRIQASKTELEVMALLSRLGNSEYFPFPALEREEASGGRSEHNHDFYSINQDGKKCPIQVKTSRNSGGYKGVIIINHYDIMRALRETLAPVDRKLAKLPSISELVLQEHRGGGIDKENLNYLNLASVYVISRIDAFNDFRRD